MESNTPMSTRHSRLLFCRQLATWLSSAHWRYTTLIGVCIETVDHLPSDMDEVIHRLLANYRTRPSELAIRQALERQSIRRTWFVYDQPAPTVTQICLTPHQPNVIVKNAAKPIGDLPDLAGWLNVSIEQLNWLMDCKRHAYGEPDWFRHYYYHTVRKRSGGCRFIESPKTRLKSIQRKINTSILSRLDVHPAAHGYRTHHSCLTHAGQHTGRKHVFLFDLVECFHSVIWPAIYQVFVHSGYTAPVSFALTALCSHRCYEDHPIISTLEFERRLRLRQRHLPQGAPTSPALSNLVLIHVDRRLQGLAQSLNMNYTRYADDLVFSTDENRDWRFLETLVGSICHEQGFSLNYRKSRHLRQHQQQRVAGLIVNSKLNIDRRDYDNLKAILTNCVRHGLDSQNKSQHPLFKQHLRGRIQYVKTVSASKGMKLEQLYKQLD